MSVIADIHKDLEEGAIRLIAEHRDCLFAEAVRMCKDPVTAEDLVSRTFAKAIQNIDSHDESRSLAAWLKTIMQNLYRNDMKRPVVRGTDPIDPVELERMELADWSSDEQLLKHSDSEALREAIKRLDPKFKQVLVMHYFSELPVKAIASALNMPVGTVLWRLNIARKILAKDLAEKLGKKPLALLAVLFLGVATLFGAWTAGLGEWVQNAFSSDSAPTAEMAQTSDSALTAEMAQTSDSAPTSEPGETSAAQSNAEESAASNSNSQTLSNEQEKTPMKAISPMKSLKKTVLAATMLATTAFTASADEGENIIQNGSFEDCADDIAAQKFKEYTFTRPAGWEGGAILIRSDANGWMGNDNAYVTGAVQLPDGQFCVGFKRAGSLSTSVTVKKSGRYTLTIQKILRKNDSWKGSLIEVCFDDATIGTISVPSNSKWEEQSFEVCLGPGEHMLKFNNPNTYDESIFLDKLSLCLVEEAPKFPLHVSCPAGVNCVVTANGEVIGEEAYANQEIEVWATPIAGKTYASVPAGWTLCGTSIVKSFTVGDEGLEIVIPGDGLVDVSAGFTRTFEITASGYNGATLADFPALIRLSTSISKFSYDDFVLPNGGDLRFTTEAGVPLAHEIDTWNENGESLVWVKVPSFAKDVKIIAYYGNVTPWAVDTASVWSDYAGVWHFAQFDTTDTTTRSQASSPNSTAEEGIDAHIANTTGTKINQEGFFGTGVQTADTGSDAGLWMKDAGAKSPLDGGAQFTISGWFKHKAENYSWDHIFYKRSKSDNSGGDYTGAFAIENSSSNADFKVDPRGSSAKKDPKMPQINPRGAWVQLTFVYDNTTCHFYENDTFVDDIAIDACVDNDAPLAVGNNSNYEKNGGIDSPWKGWVDEVRFSKGVKSADWIAAEYECAAGNILSMGEVQMIVSEELVTVTITADDSKETYTATTNDEPVTSGDAVSSNAMVTVVATPKADYLYFPVPEGWTKGTEEKTITAKFRAENDPTVIAIPDPTAIADIRVKVTVEPPQYGSITGVADEYEYGAQATLTAEPEDGFVFAGWTGAAEGETANPLTLTMDDNKTIGAIFKPVNLASNGSFEEGIGGIKDAPGYVDTNFTFPTGWQKESWGVIGYRGSDADGTGDGDVMAKTVAVKDGRYCMLLKSDVSISYTNAVVSRSGRYKLSAYALNRNGYTGGKYDGFVDGYKVFSASVNSSAEWSLLSGEVVLGPGVHTLSFKNTGTCQCLIDAISLTFEESVSPEIVVDTEHVNQTFDYQNVGVERTINVKVEVPSVGYTIKYSTTGEGEYTTVPIKYWQAGEYTIYYRVEAEGMEPAAGFGTVTIGENWMPNGSFEIGTWISAHEGNYGYLDSVQAATEGWKTLAGADQYNAHIAKKGAQAWFKSGVNPADGDYAHVVYRQGKISAPMNLARSGKYQFSCKYLCRTFQHDGEGGQQKAIVKIDDQEIATIENVKNPNSWTDFSTEKFQLKKGEHTITIEGTTSQNSTILLDALRLDFKGGNGLVFIIE